ncbi:MAG: hypothetical protein A3C06_03985 [Candidatus Taylorbacteria bacterium RIFCSPHIGHO2_02_FULL_46_13]|uniref:Uncharacterized protein n=1 Tax=Candidatus Taylorbacteria bacterium RIFCSPHIGHO2_02_FULL_46_13 TaxID=1802312 RepID=A0A1G2MTM9_9BACT|nr:MAG: hypothetical protein A3C06_03985 [Candidatus Taylorbacteria bacterium RIFCSPHIGHO2_02_FULL_46_13]
MKKRYWLRVGFGLATVFLAYSLFLDWLNHIGAPISSELNRVIYEIGYPFIFIRFLSVGFRDSFGALLLGDVIAFVFFFFIGVLIGWFYGKIKGRKKLQAQASAS